MPVRTLTQHYLRKKINKTKRNHLERILEAFRRHLEGMREHALVNKNFFLRLYVYTSYADSKRSVSDRWLTNDKEAQSALKLTKNYTIINVKYLCVNFLVSVLSV